MNFDRRCNRRTRAWGLALGLYFLLNHGGLRAESFQLGGTTVELSEVTDQTEVGLRSLRLNRAQGVWNAEMTVRNLGDRLLPTPLLVVVEAVTGSAGVLGADQVGTPGGRGPWWDLSPRAAAGGLAPGTETLARTITLARSGDAAPRLTLRVYAHVSAPPARPFLAVTRVLDAAGLPLGGARVTQSGPSGERAIRAEVGAGFVSLGGRPGEHTWRFEGTSERYLPVWIRAEIRADESMPIRWLTSPRLTERSTNETTVAGDAATLSVPGGAVELRGNAGTFAAGTRLGLTLLGEQALPLELPGGWIPGTALWIESTQPFRRAATLRLAPGDRWPAGRTGVWVRLDTDVVAWRVVQSVALQMATPVTLPCDRPGAYALVFAEVAGAIPPTPNDGTVLLGLPITEVQGEAWNVTGVVIPPVAAASTNASLVTAHATLTATLRAASLSSGTRLRCEVAEHYRLQDGTDRSLPRYETTFSLFRSFAATATNLAQIEFPLRPWLLLPGEQLAEAQLRVTVIEPAAFDGGILNPGGELHLGGLRLQAGAGDLAGPQAVRVRGGVPKEGEVIRFDLELPGVESGRAVEVDFEPPLARGAYVLARETAGAAGFGLEPVARLSSDGQSLRNLEFTAPQHLRGLDRSGSYRVVSVASLPGVVSGMVTGTGSLAGLPVRVEGEPWAVFTDDAGHFLTLATPGTRAFVVTQEATQRSVRHEFTQPSEQGLEGVELRLGQEAPQVVSVTPADLSTNVPLLTAVQIRFSQPIVNHETVAHPLRLLEVAGGAPVAARVRFDDDGRGARLYPSNALSELTRYAVALAGDLANASGGRLVGRTNFQFTTRTNVFVQRTGAQLYAEAPGTNGLARVIGTAGMAQPRQPVLFVNDSTGQTTTLNAQADGSFTNSLPATDADRLRIVLVNTDGSRTEVPVGRQLFPDGSVALFSGGGSFSVVGTNSEIREVTVTVPPGATLGRTKLKLELRPLTDLPSVTEQTPPEAGAPIGLYRLAVEGDPLRTRVQLKFQFDPAVLEAQLAAAPGTNDPILVASAPRRLEQFSEEGLTNVMAYEYLGTLAPTEGAGAGAARATAAPAGAGSHSLVASWVLEAAGTGVLDAVLFGVRQWPKFEITGRTVTAELAGGLTMVPDTDVPIGGAVVRGRSRSSLNRRPFSLQPGELFSTSDADGVFRMLAPVSYQAAFPAPLIEGFSLIASHPAFPRQYAANTTPNLIDPRYPFGVGLLAFDRRRPPDTVPPVIEISQEPLAPEAGSVAFVRVEAVDEGGSATVYVQLDSRTPPDADVHVISLGHDLWRVQCDRKAKVVIRAAAVDAVGNRGERVYAVNFGLPIPRGPLANDPFGPYVVFSQPDDQATGVPTAAALSLLFSERLAGDIVTNAPTYLTLSPAAGVPQAAFGGDEREVIVSYPGLQPDTDYTLTVQQVRDRNGQVFDQNPDPASPAAEPFILRFRTASVIQTQLTGLTEGGGVVMRGALAYVLDRGGSPELQPDERVNATVNVYDVSQPASPRLLGRRYLPGPARAMALVPDYSYTLDFRVPGTPDPTPPDEPSRSDLLAVVGKLRGGGYLRVFDLSRPFEDSGAIASTVFNLDETALINRLVWSPPYLVAVENSASAPALRVLNLQAALLGDVYRHLPGDFRENLPLFSSPGIDANHDGDFVDTDDQLPLLGQDAVDESAGEVDLLTLTPNIRIGTNDVVLLTDTTRFIVDAAVDGGSGFVGALITAGLDRLVTLVNGRPIETNRVSEPASFQGMAIGHSLPSFNRVEFPGYYPKRVLIVPIGIRRIAVVNLIRIDNTGNRIALVDCSRPDVIGEVGEIPLDLRLFGLLQGAELDGAGRIVLSTVVGPGQENFVLLDIRRLLEPAAPGGLHPSIVGVVPGAGGSSLPFVARRSGLNLVSLRNQNVVTQTSPLIRLVPCDETWTDPFTAGDLTSRVDEFRSLSELELLLVVHHDTNSTLIPGEPGAHFQVMAELPGGAGPQIELAALSLDAQGKLVERRAGELPPALLPNLPLRRLSDDPSKEGFNAYLSRPLALAARNLSAADLGHAFTAHPRHVLIAGTHLRVGIPAAMASNPVLNPFAGSGDVTRVGDTNRAPVRLGASLMRPVFNLQPQLEADDYLRLSTTVDWINNLSCPGQVSLHFAANLDCRVDLRLDGRPVTQVTDDLGRTHPVATDLEFQAGAHSFLLDSTHAGAPGTHRFEVIARGFAGLPPNVALSESGTLEHEVEIHHAFPIGHTLLQGVDIWDGHLTYSQGDVFLPGRRLNLEFARTYTSAGNRGSGPLGAGWTHNYHCRLIHDDCGRWTVVGGDGNGNAFTSPRSIASLAARYSSLLPAVTAGGRFEFFQPQIGFHSTLVRDTGRPSEAWFFTKAALRYHFVVEPKLSTPQSTVFTLREIQEPNGNRLRLDYLDNDADPATLDTVTELDPLGALPKRGFRFAYRTVVGEPRLVELTGFNHQGSADLLGLRLEFEYDAAANLIASTRREPDGSVRRETYGYTAQLDGPLAHNLIATTNANGLVTQYTYFPSGAAGYYAAARPLDGIPPHEVVQTVTLVGATHGDFAATTDAVTHFRYDWANAKRWVTDPRGVDGLGQSIPETEYTVNAYGATTRIVGPLGQETVLRWATDHRDGSVTDEAGNAVNDVLMTSKIDAEGQEHHFEYRDGRGNVTAERIVPAPTKAPVRAANGNALTDVVSRSAYDPLFNQRTNHVDPEGHATSVVIDSRTGNVLRVTDAEGYFTQSIHEPNGDLRERIDARGYRTQFIRYDLYGNAEIVRTEVEQGGRSIQTENRFDERSRLREVRDTFGHHRLQTYDGLDRLTRVQRLVDLEQNHAGPAATEETEFYPAGEVRIRRNALGLATQFGYDALGRRIRVEQLGVRQADGSRSNYVSTLTYDPAGNLTGETDSRAVTFHHRFDALNRRVETAISGPFGPDQVLSRASYDRVSNVTNSIDLHESATAFEHDGLYRIVATRLPFPGAVVRVTLDAVGRRWAFTDANGYWTTNTFDALGRLRRVVDPEGNAVEYDYDAAGNPLAERRLSPGLVTEWEFDGLNRPTRKTQRGPGIPTSGYVVRTTFRDAVNEVETTDARGVRSVVRKDGLDRLATSIIDEGGLGLESRFTCDAAGNVLTVQDPQNGDIDATLVYDELSRRLRSTLVTTPDDQGAPVFEECVYDGVGQILVSRDRRGIERRFHFDNLGRERGTELREDLSNGGAWLRWNEITYDDLGRSVTRTDANGRSSEFHQDRLGRPERMVDALRNETYVGYDGVNRRWEVDALGQRREFVFDRLNRLRQTLEFGTNRVVQTRLETIYEDTQRRRVEVDRRGLTQRSHFDALGRSVRLERSGGDTAARYGADPLVVETRTYDENGNVVQLTDARGNGVYQEYDGANRRVLLIEGYGSSVAGTNRFTLDRVGNLIEWKDPRLHGKLFDGRNTYDARYRLIATEDAQGQITRFRQDAADQRIEVIEALGGVTRYAYDELGALLSVDESARDSGTGDAGVTRFRFDANRNRLAQQDPNGNLVTYAYDALNRPTNIFQHLVVPPPILSSTHQPVVVAGGALETAQVYDAGGRVQQIRDARGQTVGLEYDHLNRLVRRSYAGFAETNLFGAPIDFQVLELEYAYDGNGNATNCMERKQFGGHEILERTVSEFDALDRLATKTRFDFDDANGRRLAFEYDAAGNRTLIQDSDGRSTRYEYDERNRVHRVGMEAGAGVLDALYEWEPDNLLRRVQLPGGSTTERWYDPVDRLVIVTNRGPAGALYSAFTYAYDLQGNRTNQVELLPAVAVVPESTRYLYDRQHRLTNVVYGAVGSLSFTYAANGNRLTEVGTDPVTGGAVNRRWSYVEQPGKAGRTFSGVNTLTRIEDLTPAAAHIDYEYDANLNQTARIQGGVTSRYRYDIRDQMIEAQSATGGARFDYNGDRMRVKKLSSIDPPPTFPEVRYLYDESAVVMEYGGASAAHGTQHKFDFGDRLLAFGTPSGAGATMSREFYLPDGLGSTANLVSEAATLVKSYQYDAWGRTRATAGTSPNRREYTGHYRDDETGLHYFGARYYDDEQARFLSQDPNTGQASLPPSLHRYLYAYANPLRYIDPTGYQNQPVNEEKLPDPHSEDEGTPKGKSDKEVDPELRNTVIDSRTGEHYVPWWSDRRVLLEAKYDLAEERRRIIQELEEARARVLMAQAAYGQWARDHEKARAAAEARAEANRMRDLLHGGHGDKAMWLAEEWANEVAAGGDGVSYSRAWAAGLIYYSGKFLEGTLNLGSGLGALVGKLQVADTAGGPGVFDYLEAAGDVAALVGYGGALKSATRPRWLLRAEQSAAGVLDDAVSAGTRGVGRRSVAGEAITEIMADKTAVMSRDYLNVVNTGMGKVKVVNRYLELGALRADVVTPRYILDRSRKLSGRAPWGLYERKRLGKFLVNEEVLRISPAQHRGVVFHEASHALDEVREHAAVVGLKSDSRLLKDYNRSQAKQFLTFNEEMRANLNDVRATAFFGDAGESYASRLLRTEGLPGLADWIIKAYDLNPGLIYSRYPKLRPIK